MASHTDEMRQRLLSRLPDWLEARLRAFNLSILNIERLGGETAHDTWQLSFVFHHDMAPDYMSIVLRRDEPGLPPSEGAARHFALLKLLKKTEIPGLVPLWLEPSGDILGAPFLTMEAADGGPASDDAGAADPGRLEELRSYTAMLARIHGLDWKAARLDEALAAPTTGDCANVALARLAAAVRGSTGAVSSLTDRALSWAGANRPSVSEICLTHGAADLSNYRFEGHEVTTVLDWRAAALSDPLADVGECCADLVGRLAGQPPAIQQREREFILDLYRDKTGRSYETLPFWEVLALLKAASHERGAADQSNVYWQRLEQIVA